jgi:hypothetical protein
MPLDFTPHPTEASPRPPYPQGGGKTFDPDRRAQALRLNQTIRTRFIQQPFIVFPDLIDPVADGAGG